MPKALWLLVIGMAVNVTGSSFLWPLNTIYIHEHLGRSLSVAGIVLMLNSAATVIGNLVGGTLFDKIGGYRSILIGISMTLLSLLGLMNWNSFIPYVIFLVIIGFGSGIIFPSMYALAGSVWKEGGRKTFNAIYIAQNLGVALGSALGGVVASYSFSLIFLANALLYMVFLAIAAIGYKSIQPATATVQINAVQESQPLGKEKLYALLIVCAGYMLCWVGYVQWQSTISAYTRELGIGISQYSLLWTVNGAMIVLVQPLINKIVKPFEKNLKIQIISGMAILAGSFMVASWATEFSGFLTAMMILTVGEMLVWPAVPAIADSLAPKGKEGFYQGIVNSAATGGRMIGPLAGGMLVDFYGMTAMFAVIIILIVIGMVTTNIYDKKLSPEQEAEPTIG